MKIRFLRAKDGSAAPRTDEHRGGISGFRKAAVVAAGCIVVAVVAAACTSGGGSAAPQTSKTAATATTSTAPKGSGGKATTTSDVRTMQAALSRVGCYRGQIDGIRGSQTAQAIRDFQTASHLAVDGIYGPNTEGMLTAAAQAGVRVCVAATIPAPSTPTTAPPPTTTTPPSAVTAPCTATAISAALGQGRTLLSFHCGSGWAAGSWTNSTYAAAFLLRSSNGTWIQPPTNACANAAALGIPPNVLNVSPCKVS